MGNDSFQSRYRWIMLFLLWLLYIAFGLVARSITPLITPILNDLRMTYSQMGFILGSWQLTYILVALMAGAILDRWGVRKSIFAGALIIGFSAAIRYFATGFLTMLIAIALFGVGGTMISIGGPKTISEWFSGRGIAVGIYTTGPWIGGLMALALTNSLVMPLVGGSWRLTFEENGMSPSQAGYAASIPIASGIPALLFIPSLIPPRFIGRMIAIFALMTTLNLILVLNTSGTPLYIGLLVLGFISSPFMPLMLLLLMESPRVKTEYMGAAGGMFFCVAEIGGFSGPALMGILVDVTGTFAAGTIFLAILCPLYRDCNHDLLYQS
jgi:MFS family permease